MNPVAVAGEVGGRQQSIVLTREVSDLTDAVSQEHGGVPRLTQSKTMTGLECSMLGVIMTGELVGANAADNVL